VISYVFRFREYWDNLPKSNIDIIFNDLIGNFMQVYIDHIVINLKSKENTSLI